MPTPSPSPEPVADLRANAPPPVADRTMNDAATPPLVTPPRRMGPMPSVSVAAAAKSAPRRVPAPPPRALAVVEEAADVSHMNNSGVTVTSPMTTSKAPSVVTTSNEINCGICHSGLREGGLEVMALPCMHCFHQECVQHWHQMFSLPSNHCPYRCHMSEQTVNVQNDSDNPVDVPSPIQDNAEPSEPVIL